MSDPTLPSDADINAFLTEEAPTPASDADINGFLSEPDEPGNIDMGTRPVVQNDDGSVSTVRTFSFQDDSGQEVLIPTVSDDGRILSDDAAISAYRTTGRHLGKFSTAEGATAYAQRLHESEAAKLSAKLSAKEDSWWKQEPENFVQDPTRVDAETQRHALELARIKVGFDEARALDGNTDKEAGILKLATTLQLPTSHVRLNYDALRKVAREAGEDPEKWANENPLLKKLLLESPDSAALVVGNTELSGLTKALFAVSDWLNSGPPLPDIAAQGAAMMRRAEPAANQTAEEARAQVLADLQSALTVSPEAAARYQQDQAAAIEKRNAPRTREELVNSTSQNAQTSVWRPFLVAWQRAKETAASSEVSNIGARILYTQGMGGNTTELEQQLHDARLRARPLNLGEGPGLQVVSDIAMGVTSSIEGYQGALERGGEGAFVGGLVGGLVTRGSPAGVAKGAEIGGKFAVTFGMAEATMALETGSNFLEIRDTKTEADEKIDFEVAAGAAVLAGVANTGIELLEFELQKKALGPVGEMLKSGSLSPLRQLLSTDAGFRGVMKRLGRAWLPGLKSAAGESGEEGAQTAVGQGMKYLAEWVQSGKMPTRKPFGLDEIKESAFVALPSGFAMSAPGPMVSTLQVAADVALRGVQVSQYAKATKQMQVVMGLAQDATAQGAAPAVARMVTEATAETGAPVDTIFVTAKEVKKFYQENEADGVLEQHLGEGAQERVDTAAAAGQQVAVPLEVMLKTWGATDAAKALLPHMTTQQGGMTAAELADGGAQRIQDEARRISEKHEEKLQWDADTSSKLEQLRAELVDSGLYTKRQGETMVGIWAKWLGTQGFDHGISPDELLKRTRVHFGLAGKENQRQLQLDTPEAVDEQLRQTLRSMPLPVRARHAFVDVVTGGRNRAAWDLHPRVPGKLVAAVTTPDMKPINDSAMGGHDTGNEAMRVLAGVVDAHDAEFARDGTNLLLHVDDEAHLARVLADVRAVLPKTMTVVGSIGADTNAAKKAAGAQVDAMRADGRLPADRKLGTRFTLERSDTFSAGRAVKHDITPTMLAAVSQGGHLANEDTFHATVHWDKDWKDLLSKTGFDAAGPRAFVASLDLRGLRDINTHPELGDAVGDLLMDLFAGILVDVGGQAVLAAHLSGDEFAMKSNSKAELEAVIESLHGALRGVGVEATLKGEAVIIRPLFRSGIGERTYGAADRQLNRDKAAERDVPRGVDGIAGAEPRSAGVPLEGDGVGRDAVDVGGSADPGAAAGAGEARAEGTPGPGSPGGAEVATAGALAGEVAPAADVTDEGTPPPTEAEIAAILEQRGAKYGVRTDERALLAIGLNTPEQVAAGRAAIVAMRSGLTAQEKAELKAAKSKKAKATVTAKAEARAAERRAAATAYVDWVEGIGAGVQEKGTAYGRDSLRVDHQQMLDVGTWGRALGLHDPMSGIEGLMAAAYGTTNPKGYKGPKRKMQAQPVELAKHGAHYRDDLGAVLDSKKRRQDNESDGPKKLGTIHRTKPPISSIFNAEEMKPLVDVAKRDLEWQRTAQRFVDQPVAFTDKAGHPIAITSVRGGLGGARPESNWRVTWFDSEGPAGHTDRDTHKEAMRAARDYGATLESAVKVGNGRNLAQGNEADGPKNLVVQHNLTAEALQHADSMGGMAAPSLAIGRQEHPLENFGEVTLLGGSEMVDPKQGAPTFDADVYSPRYPDTRFKLKGKQLRELEARLEPFAKVTGSYLGELDEKLADDGATAPFASRSMRPAFELAWLSEQGTAPAIPYKKAEAVYPGVVDSPAVREFFSKLYAETMSYHVRDEQLGELSQVVKAAIEASDEETTMAREYTSDWFDEGVLRVGIAERLAREVRQFEKEATGTMVDKYKLEDLLTEAVDKAGRPAFEAWASKAAKEVLADSYIRKFSASGNEMKVAHTLENVLREMTRSLRGGEGFDYGLGSVRAQGAKQFKSLEEIGADRHRVIPAADFEKLKDENGKRFEELSDKVGLSLQNLGEAIGESYKRGHSLKAELRKSGAANPSPKLVRELEEFRRQLAEMPTGYFESKPQRVVALSEFKAAVVPSNLAPAAREVLQRHGVKLYEYDRKNEADRKRVIQEAAVASKVLFQDEAPPAKGAAPKPPRGELTITEHAAGKAYNVLLQKDADVTTVMHESAHIWLDMMGDLAALPDAPARTKETWARALKALGADGTGVITDDQHEVFARGFEAWLYEGKAPTRELASVFTQFKLWLVDVYRAVSSLKVQLTPELRDVYARMLATDEELQRHKLERGRPLFETAQEAGLSPREWREYQQQQREAEAHAVRRAEVFALRGSLRQHEADFKQKLQDIQAQLEEVYETLAPRQAQKVLEGAASMPLFGKPEVVKLDRAAVEAMVGKGAARRFATTDEGGTHPDEVATFAGYATGQEMLEAIVQLPTKETWVKRGAEERMAQLHPDVIEKRDELRKLVAEGMSSVSEKRVLEELASLTARGPNGSPPAPVEAVREAARLIVERTPLGQVHAAQVLVKERAAANAKAKAAAKGNLVEARAAAEEQLLQGFIHHHTLKAAELRDGLQADAARLSKQSSRSKLGKAHPVYRDAIDFLLEASGLTGEKPLAPADWAVGMAAVQQALAQMQGDGVSVGEWVKPVGEALARGQWKTMRVQDARHLQQALDNITAAARARSVALVDGVRMDKAEVAAQMVREMASVLPAQTPPGTRSSNTMAENILERASAIDGFLTNPSDLVRELIANNDESMTWRAIVLPMRRAKHREADLLKAAIAPIISAFEAVPKGVRKRFGESINGAALFPTHTGLFKAPRKRFELLMMALNAGNESNLQRLLDGRTITEQQLISALGVLTAEELRWVQSVWDAAEAFKEESFALEERVSGLRPEAVMARPLQLAAGVLAGGYFPAVYERAASQVGERQSAGQLAALMDPSYTKGTTPHSHLKARAERVEAVISLEPRAIYGHLAQAAHDIAFREVIQSVGGLILEPTIDSELKRRLGDAKARGFLQWVKDVGTMRGAMPTTGLQPVIQYVRGVMAPALLGWSLPTAIGDFANLPAAVASTPLTAKHLAGGLGEFYAGLGRQLTGGTNEAREEALKKSGELRFMEDTLKRDFMKHMRGLTDSGPLARGPIAWVKDHAFDLMEGVNIGTATPVWIGAYRQAKAEGREESAAVRFADDILTQVFPSHSAVDQAGILRDKGFWGLATMFYGYLSVAYRAQRKLIKGRQLSALVGFWVSAGVLGELLMGRGAEAADADPEEPDDELLKWRNWFLRKLVAAPLSTLPFEAAGQFEARVMGKPTNPRGSPVNAYLDTLMDAAAKVTDGEALPEERAAAIARGASMMLGIPGRPLTTTAPYVARVATGDAEVGGFWDAAGGMVYGKRDKQPANIPSVLAGE